MSKAIIGDLSIETADGTVLTASTDLRLAWLWAENVLGDQWPHIGYRQQCEYVADALAALREGYAESE